LALWQVAHRRAKGLHVQLVTGLTKCLDTYMAKQVSGVTAVPV
jgi:hypothetical protein